MKIITSSVSIIPQESGIDGIYKQCELAGRTAYKSEDRITEGSAKKFVEALMKSNHGAVLEHGTVYLAIPDKEPDEFGRMDYGHKGVGNYSENKYSRVTYFDYKQEPNEIQKDYCSSIPRTITYVTTNLRVLFENNWMDDLQYLCEPTEHHEKRVTAKFICSRSIAQEITRHRVFSFLMESQRYVGYNKDKFGGEITVIMPEWVKDEIFQWADTINPLTGESYSYLVEKPITESVWDMQFLDRGVNCWIDALQNSEEAYMYLTLEHEKKAEEARSVLPNDCKTELIVTGFVSDWEHFFDLRSKGTTGKPHPDIKILADDLLLKFIKNGFIEGV